MLSEQPTLVVRRYMHISRHSMPKLLKLKKRRVNFMMWKLESFVCCKVIKVRHRNKMRVGCGAPRWINFLSHLCTQTFHISLLCANMNKNSFMLITNVGAVKQM